LLTLTYWARAGWDLADEALREMAIEFEHRNAQASPLRAYIMEALDPRRDCLRHASRPRGPKKADFALRDIAIVIIVADLCWTFGLRPKRNLATKRASACDIAAEALTQEGLAIGWRAAAAVWDRYGDMISAG
jgi:hypothetical protein